MASPKGSGRAPRHSQRATASAVSVGPVSKALRPLDRAHEEITAALRDGVDAAEAETLFRLLDRVTRNAEQAARGAGGR